MLALACVGAPISRAEPPTNEDITGSTWKLVSTKYGDDQEWTNVAADEDKIKMMTGTHFVWVSYQSGDGRVQGTGGGTYTLKDGTYIERVEFGGGNVRELRGQDHVFTLDLRGDRLEQTGQLSTGFKIAEVWQRVR